MTNRDFLEIFAEIVGCPSSDIDESTSFFELEEWDSLAIVEIIALFDERFGIAIKAKDILTCYSIGELMSLAGNHII